MKKHKDSFPHSPTAKPTRGDYVSWAKWNAYMVCGAILSSLGFYGDQALGDAVATYYHYKENTGSDYEVSYRQDYQWKQYGGD
ncbi:hypothetical protein [Microtetraspora malaysiensis]|uniref:Uncharacterized protein n=1 Tax=Microtetraspora malaysiensis TaxID=161358 RepID=A0ABW6SHY0_9ACTN